MRLVSVATGSTFTSNDVSSLQGFFVGDIKTIWFCFSLESVLMITASVTRGEIHHSRQALILLAAYTSSHHVGISI